MRRSHSYASRYEHRSSRQRKEQVQRPWDRSVVWLGLRDSKDAGMAGAEGWRRWGLRHGRENIGPSKPGLEVPCPVV